MGVVERKYSGFLHGLDFRATKSPLYFHYFLFFTFEHFFQFAAFLVN